MDVLPKALPEQFFLDASDECLTNLGQLVDVGISCCINEYLSNPNANPAVVARIQKFFSEPVKAATFHQELHDKGIVNIVRNLNLDAIGALSDVTKMQELLNVLSYVQSNRKYVKSSIKPRSREDYELFIYSAPEEYRNAIAVNRDYFYDPKAREARTGLGFIVRGQADIDIAIKGLKFRILMFKKYESPKEKITRV